MSIQSSMAVMKAKLAGNEMALKALAMQGDVEAAAALKSLVDAKTLGNDEENERKLRLPQVPPVLDQMVPPSGLAAYACGGRVRGFDDGGPVPIRGNWWNTNVEDRDRWDAQFAPREGPPASNMELLKSLWDKLRYGTRGNPNYVAPGTSDRESPAAQAVQEVAAGNPNIDDRPKRGKYSGIARGRNPSPDIDSEPEVRYNSGPHNMMRAEPGVPDAINLGPVDELKDTSDADLKKLLADREPLLKKRDALRDLSRQQLEGLYADTMKLHQPSKLQQLGLMGAAMAKGRGHWSDALGLGGEAAINNSKADAAALVAAKAAYQKADMLEQQAQVHDQLGDVDTAYKLRQEADKLREQIAVRKSTQGLQKSQAGLADAQAQYYRDVKPEVDRQRAEAAMVSARRPRGSGGGAGGKPPTAVQRATLIMRDAAERAKADGKDLDVLDPASRDAYLKEATAAVDTLLKQGGGGLAGASPATPSSKFKVLGPE
jgi:hypothetical protein